MLPIEPSLLLGRIFSRRVLSNVTLTTLRQCPVEPIVNEIVSLAKNRGLEMDSNGIDELVEEHNQELTIEKLMDFICASQQEVMEEMLTANELYSKVIREMLNAWETVESYIERSIALI
ncbi:hypothetical protein AVEN_47036-1 [Araneus ventricosus]|uniref:Uncharacterized protein n=1 Tax=Araneus ventricosus TaxID=182803 RepID=A0A4Y2EWX3_ARAVE|nr:hypothetical protein AVEN_47036-1 [Araneus ventricosus]